ncbi:MAG: response regulator transcription factor [Halochromatium sp.]|uniref:response regulator transcription factor n=1 Tax=Halochromatium sp. TaxID=2049430 RepID=UPI00397ABC04
MDDKASIIVVEDDRRMGLALQRHLTKAGYRVILADSGQSLRQAYRRTEADLVLLDLNLGNEDGIDIARELASTTSVAVIIITGRLDLEDRVEGLDAGADDYLVKPFEIDELLARIRAVLRRRALDDIPAGVVECGPFRLDTATQILHRNGASATDLTLTGTEARLFGILLRQHGRAVSRERLSNRGPQDPGDRSIDVHIGNIRRKLREAGLGELAISPVRGFGYRLILNGTDAPTETPAEPPIETQPAS